MVLAYSLFTLTLGGVYYKPRRGEALVQYLLSISAADQYSRRSLQLPSQRGVDFRASVRRCLLTLSHQH
jgi:hypothetical protein